MGRRRPAIPSRPGPLPVPLPKFRDDLSKTTIVERGRNNVGADQVGGGSLEFESLGLSRVTLDEVVDRHVVGGKILIEQAHVDTGGLDGVAHAGFVLAVHSHQRRVRNLVLALIFRGDREFSAINRRSGQDRPILVDKAYPSVSRDEASKVGRGLTAIGAVIVEKRNDWDIPGRVATDRRVGVVEDRVNVELPALPAVDAIPLQHTQAAAGRSAPRARRGMKALRSMGHLLSATKSPGFDRLAGPAGLKWTVRILQTESIRDEHSP